MKRRQFLANVTGGSVSSLLGITAIQARSISSDGKNHDSSYHDFLVQVYQQAVRQGMNADLVRPILNLSVPNQQVIQRDHKQSEFTLTWSQYYQKVVTSTKIKDGRVRYQQLRKLLASLWQDYQVDPSVVLGIWGLESAYGKYTGKFNIIDALATLAYEGRRAKFFRSELMNALVILNHQDIRFESMSGSYAGAMGQPQFMPSAYLRYAVDFSGKGQRDIWTNTEDVLASIANYLKKSGWHVSEPWGQKINVPDDLSQSMTGRTVIKTLKEWEGLGVRREDGSGFSQTEVKGAVIRPDGVGGQAFMVYRNFNVIRRYNPSDYYALAVGLLGDAILA